MKGLGKASVTRTRQSWLCKTLSAPALEERLKTDSPSSVLIMSYLWFCLLKFTVVCFNVIFKALFVEMYVNVDFVMSMFVQQRSEFNSG